VQINFGRQGMKWLALEYAKPSADRAEGFAAESV
jgi:hypothetical protein